MKTGKETKESLLSSRRASVKFVTRFNGLGVAPGSKPFTKLFSNLAGIDANLISKGVRVNKISYNFDPDTLIKSAFAGLFWFNDDYTEVTDICGIREFTKGDVIAKLSVSPDGGHIDYEDKTHKSPRGRVSVYDGHVIISVGTECPDPALQLVVDAFGLRDYKGNKLRIFKDEHWDVGGIGGLGDG